MPGVAIGVDRWRRHHDVSILIAAGGVGRLCTEIMDPDVVMMKSANYGV